MISYKTVIEHIQKTESMSWATSEILIPMLDKCRTISATTQGCNYSTYGVLSKFPRRSRSIMSILHRKQMGELNES